jgi:hypothetical protein
MMTRFADRDMVMRYHWGLAVGHIYTQSQLSDSNPTMQSFGPTERYLDAESDTIGLTPEDECFANTGNMELSLEERDNDNWDDSDDIGTNDDASDLDGGSDSELYAFADDG